MNKYLLSLVLAFIFFIIGIATLPDYGINWDSSGHMLRGQAFAEYILTGKKTYESSEKLSPVFITTVQFASRYYFAAIEQLFSKVELQERVLLKVQHENFEQKNKQRRSFYQHKDWNGKDYLREDAGHLPMLDILSAFSNRFFYQSLGILGDIESYQLMYLMLSSIGIFIVCLFTFEITRSHFAAVIAGLSLALFPLFFAEAHFNTKDTAQAALFTGSIWAFWHIVKDQKSRYFFIFIGFITAALGIKWNVMFLPFIFLPWLLILRKTIPFKKWITSKKTALFLVLGFVLIVTFLIIVTPSDHPITRLLLAFEYYKTVGVGSFLMQPKGFVLPMGFNIYPLILVFTQTPSSIIICIALFILFVLLKKPKNDPLKTHCLLLLWFLVPVVRISIPNAWSYGGLRQIMEIIPVMAIMAGIGAGYIIQISNVKFQMSNFKTKFLKPLLIILYLLFLIVPILRLHPNENAYFNFLAGGTRGAEAKNLIDWTLTNGNIYKQGVTWLNQNAEKNANLAHIDGTMYAISPLWLRADISLSPDHFSGFLQKGEYIIKLFNPLRPPVFAARYEETFLRPIHIISVDGIGLLYIYKNDKNHAIINLSNEKNTIKFHQKPVSSADGDYFEIDLRKNIYITKIEVFDPTAKCYKNSQEAIGFLPEGNFGKGIDPANLFILNEKTVDNNRKKVTFLFPGELARFIYIYPNDNSSCFASGKIVSISYLEL